jgi:hypothetical protein
MPAARVCWPRADLTETPHNPDPIETLFAIVLPAALDAPSTSPPHQPSNQ